MQSSTLFQQNFAVSESLLQLFQIFSGLSKADLKDDPRLAICAHWGAPSNSLVQHLANDRLTVLARAAARIPEAFVMNGGLDFLLRQTVVVACTALEAFFWDVLRENVLTIVKARKSRADDSLTKHSFSLGDYLSIQQYSNPDVRLKAIILKSFERGTLSGPEAIEKIAGILTVRSFWEEVQRRCGESATNLRRQIQELIQRRNQIAHRADRPEEGEEVDGHGLRPIELSWVNVRIQAAKTLVTAGATLFQEAMKRLEAEIQASREQEEIRRLASQGSTDAVN